MESWNEMSTRERVRAVAETLVEPHSVNWIREQADVSSWETTKDELELLADQNRLRRVDIDDNVHYVPDYTRRFLDRIKELAEENTKQELREEIAAIADEIEEYQETYDVASLDELEESLTESEFSSEEIHERNRVIEFWEENLYYKRLIGHALHLYDDIEETMRISEDDVPPVPPRADG